MTPQLGHLPTSALEFRMKFFGMAAVDGKRGAPERSGTSLRDRTVSVQKMRAAVTAGASNSASISSSTRRMVSEAPKD